MSDISLEPRSSCLVIRIDRPEKRNALRVSMLKALVDALDSPDARNAPAVIITGSGTAFSAGADMAEFGRLSVSEIRTAMWGDWRTLIRRIDEHPRPVIAAVNGFAVGGGFEIAAACHIRIASAEARFALPEISHGHLPGAGGIANMLRLLPASAAAHYLLTGDHFDAEQARQWGFVSLVVPPGEAVDGAIAISDRIAGLEPLAVELTMQAITGMRDGNYHTALALERSLNDLMIEQGRDAMYRGFGAFVARAADSPRVGA